MNYQQKLRSTIVYQRNLISFTENNTEINFHGKLKIYAEVLRVQKTIDDINEMSVEQSLMQCDDYTVSAVSSFYNIIIEAKKAPAVKKTWGLSV